VSHIFEPDEESCDMWLLSAPQLRTICYYWESFNFFFYSLLPLSTTISLHISIRWSCLF